MAKSPSPKIGGGGGSPQSPKVSAPADGGRLFQIFAAATGKGRSPMVLCFDRGVCSDNVDAERNRLRELMSATLCNPSARYDGAVPFRQR